MDGRRMKVLCDALCECFDQDSLAQLIRFRLDKDLARLVAPGGFNTVVFGLVEHASREGWVGDLIVAAGEERPGNPALRSLRGELPFAEVKPGREPHVGEWLEWVKLLIDLVFSEYERAHLRALAADGPFMADVQPGSTFEGELRRLLSLQLIGRHPNRGIRSLFAREGRADVKDHLFITERGRTYLKVFDEARS
jgi:hypothetical protein